MTTITWTCGYRGRLGPLEQGDVGISYCIIGKVNQRGRSSRTTTNPNPTMGPRNRDSSQNLQGVALRLLTGSWFGRRPLFRVKFTCIHVTRCIVGVRHNDGNPCISESLGDSCYRVDLPCDNHGISDHANRERMRLDGTNFDIPSKDSEPIPRDMLTRLTPSD